jgi:hypothetical protein
LTKAEELIIGTKNDVNEMDDKIHDVENVNEKYAVEHRRIQKYREDLSVLLDKVIFTFKIK